MILRDYQQRLVAEANAAYRFLYNAPLVVLSTGGGKTVCFAQITKDAVADGLVVWIIAHRKELINQASGKLNAFGVGHGIIRAGEPKEYHRQVQVASIQTLTKRLKDGLPKPDLIIIDECQHAPASGYKKVFEEYPDASLLGFTATPCRLNGAGLGTVFDHMILGPSNQWLTDNKFLAPARYYAPPQKADLSKVHTARGDYVVNELEEVMDDGEITGDAVAHYKRICDGVPMLVFCVSVAHAHHVAAQYVAAGYRAAAVDGKLSDDERDERISGLGNGRYQIITSCDLIGEGLDVPSVSAVQLLRPTQSPALHLQQIGRGLRPDDGKTHLTVLDHVGNTRKHGFASTDFKWSLEGLKKKVGEKPVATRTCEQCYSVHRTAKECPFCGFVYPVKPRTLTTKKVIDGELVEVEQTAEERADEVRSAQTHGELVAIAKARGYKRPAWWALKTLRGRSYVHLLPKIQ